jgi:sugar lactone lactonase YvrE
METTQVPPETTSPRLAKRESRNWGGIILLVLVSVLVLYGVYLFQLKPMLSMRLPQHQPLPPDSPPVLLTSFQVREGGKDLSPQNIAVGRDSIYVSFIGESLIQIYSPTLKQIGSLHLDKPAAIIPTAIAVTDSQLIVADTIKGLVAVFDRDGDYLNSVAWYPGRYVRIQPTQIATDGKLLTVVDPKAAQVAVISLVNQQPFFDFLELMDLIPGEDHSRLREPSAACITPEGSIWIGDASGKAAIYSPTGDFVNELEQPNLTKITAPIGFAVADGSKSVTSGSTAHWKPDLIRVHLVDKTTGKVYVYDLSGRLKLVYPQDRDLSQPTSIAINSERREIFITESATRSITVFGY